MRSMFSIEEVAQMLDMEPKQVESEIEDGYLGYDFKEGEKKITLYDLEKYMGEEQTRTIISEFMQQKGTDSIDSN